MSWCLSKLVPYIDDKAWFTIAISNAFSPLYEYLSEAFAKWIHTGKSRPQFLLPTLSSAEIPSRVSVTVVTETPFASKKRCHDHFFTVFWNSGLAGWACSSQYQTDLTMTTHTATKMSQDNEDKRYFCKTHFAPIFFFRTQAYNLHSFSPRWRSVFTQMAGRWPTFLFTCYFKRRLITRLLHSYSIAEGVNGSASIKYG